MRWLRRVLLLLLLVLAVAGGGAWWTRGRLITPYRGFADAEVFVDLPPGTREADIAARLAAAGVVPDRYTFQLAAYLAHAERRLRAGEYRFAEAATPFQVIDRLVRGDVYTIALTFPEGLTLHEMAAIFERHGLGAASDFEGTAASGALASAIDPGAPNLEGYLFPSTYLVSRHTNAATAVRVMFGQFMKEFDAELRAEAAAQQLSVRDVVTLASLIEKETAQPDERPIVSAVYRNRLRKRMALQCDPTVIYALMRAGRWNGNLTRADLQMDSPFNTYRYPGLPPGPIASPGRSSLAAAVHPADVPYLYFVSRNDGTHVFATTLAEHNRNVVRWQKTRHRN